MPVRVLLMASLPQRPVRISVRTGLQMLVVLWNTNFSCESVSGTVPRREGGGRGEAAVRRAGRGEGHGAIVSKRVERQEPGPLRTTQESAVGPPCAQKLC